MTVSKNKRISSIFNVPMRTLQNWKRSLTWQGKLYGKLGDFESLLRHSKLAINKRFTKEEIEYLQIICKDTVIEESLFLEHDAIEIFFTNQFVYHKNYSMEFTEQDIQLMQASIKSKSGSLDILSKYTLLEIVCKR